MTDVALRFRNGAFDVELALGDLVGEDGLETAVALSLFTDRRVEQSELYAGETDRRGWWGDAISDTPGDRIGSKLWLLDRSKPNHEARALAEQYAREALAWMILDGLAENVEVKATLIGRERIDLEIKIDKPRDQEKLFYRYQLMWDAQFRIQRI